MAIASAVGAAIATGIAGLAGGAINSRAAGNAARQQRQATDQAIALERERDARAERRYQAELAAYTQAYEADQAMRRQILRKHGYDVPEPRKPGAAGKVGPAPAGAAPAGDGTLAKLLQGRQTMGPPGPGGGVGPQGAGLMDSQGGPITGGIPTPVGGPPMAIPNRAEIPPMMEGGTLGDISGWSNWKRGI